jgi:uncharacterized protein YbbC (DUF1343 family)
MTIAEYALMINGEKWLKDKKECKLKIVKIENYKHSDDYQITVKPSPNLPNMLSIYLYPSLGLFEGTKISVGRGTPMPFQIYGHPEMLNTNFTFIPKSITGASKHPPYEGQICKGFDLRKTSNPKQKFTLKYLINAYKNSTHKENFFNDSFNYLAGNNILKQQIIKGMKEEEIRKTWEYDINNFLQIRKKYLLYYE